MSDTMKKYWVRKGSLLTTEQNASMTSQGVYLASDIEPMLKFIKTIPCSCAHSNPHSSQEWDRRHESWCPYPEAQHLLDRLKEQ